eukprot:TRINITY_DN45387_c0_g1_i1.p1 TRINITY_DN45387_c0_g1~~TRINITY_DN45387_c0_g1_i1.p1  ORF type:complete len:336 (+),score=81.95 TRINITY_DN45387_c0_g1_i1:209-1216(+)
MESHDGFADASALVSRSEASHTPWVVAALTVLFGLLRGRSSGRSGRFTIVFAYLAGLCTAPLSDLLLLLRLRWHRKFGDDLRRACRALPSPAPGAEAAEAARAAAAAAAAAAATTEEEMELSTLTPEEALQIKAFKDLVESSEWQRIDTKDGTERFLMSLENSPLRLVRGSGVVRTTLEVCHNFMCKHENFELMMQSTDAMNFERRVVEIREKGRAVLYGAFKLPSIIWNRDFVWQGCSAVLPGREIVVLANSIEHPSVPERPEQRLVRGEISISGYWFREQAPGLVAIDYVVQANPKGSLPTWVVNLVAKDQADNVTRLRQFFESLPEAPRTAA